MQSAKRSKIWDLSRPSLLCLSEGWSPHVMGRADSSGLLYLKYFQCFKVKGRTPDACTILQRESGTCIRDASYRRALWRGRGCFSLDLTFRCLAHVSKLSRAFWLRGDGGHREPPQRAAGPAGEGAAGTVGKCHALLSSRTAKPKKARS